MQHATSDHRLLHFLLTVCRCLGTVHGSVATKVSRAPTVARDKVTMFLLLHISLSTEESTLDPFPGLDSSKEQHGFDKDDAPLPRDTRVLEDTFVNNGDVQDGERKDETSHDTEKEEPIGPDVVHPLGQVALGIGLHPEEASAEVHHLPGEEEGEPGHTGECGGTGTEHSVAGLAVLGVTVYGQIAIAPREHDEGKGSKAKSRHPDAVNHGIDDDFPGENTFFLNSGQGHVR